MSLFCDVKRPDSGRRSCVHRQEPGHMFVVTGEMGRGPGPSVAWTIRKVSAEVRKTNWIFSSSAAWFFSWRVLAPCTQFHYVFLSCNCYELLCGLSFPEPDAWEVVPCLGFINSWLNPPGNPRLTYVFVYFFTCLLDVCWICEFSPGCQRNGNGSVPSECPVFFQDRQDALTLTSV